jgi:hypothetical protein
MLAASILTVLMLITISLTTTVSSNAPDVEKKESPLYRIRVRQTISERIGSIIEDINARFMSENRIFFVRPLTRLFQSDGDNIMSVAVVPSLCLKCVIV